MIHGVGGWVECHTFGMQWWWVVALGYNGWFWKNWGGVCFQGGGVTWWKKLPLQASFAPGMWLGHGWVCKKILN